MRQHKIQVGTRLRGFCCDGNRLYCVERWRRGDHTDWLTMYKISGTPNDAPILLDKVPVKGVFQDCPPRVDSSSHRVYVPCEDAGVRILHCQDGLVLSSTDPLLRCVWDSVSIAVNTADSVYVCDYANSAVCLVSVSEDRVITELPLSAKLKTYKRPKGHHYDPEMTMRHKEWIRDDIPYHVSVLGETVLVCYGRNTLVTYRRDSSTAGQVLQTPEGLVNVSSITTDSHSSFLVTDRDTDSVFVLDCRGHLRHKIHATKGSGGLQDCAVVQSQLWLGYGGGSITVMSSQ